MATLLREADSTERHLNWCYRHVRLCQKYKGTEALTESMKATTQTLTQQHEITQQKQLAREEAYDDMLLADLNLDNGVRTLNEKCKQYDREHIGANTLTFIFPDGRFTSITRQSRYKEPAAVNQLIVRIEKLGSEHDLFGQAQVLKQLVADSQAAIEKLQQAVIAEKTAITQEDLSRLAVRKQYELNYLEARKLLGKEQAERLFPKGAPHTAKKKNDNPPPAIT
ncbi:hypothetical protein L0128_08690 [candidate division KSB1 bacterium]|nr:hypothetical protein [candidate division KSB1 bacterium]